MTNRFDYDRIISIFTAIGTAVALLLIGFGVITDEGAPAEPVFIEAGGSVEAVSGFDELSVVGDVAVGDDLTFWPGDVYPLGSETNDLALFTAQATVTGTLQVTSATHGLTSISTAFCTLNSAPGTGAGDPATCHVIRSGTTITVTVLQDDWTNAATAPATIDYALVGAPD